MSDVVVLKKTYQRKATVMQKHSERPAGFVSMDFKDKMAFWNSQKDGGLIGKETRNSRENENAKLLT
jgi:hypothetical protein